MFSTCNQFLPTESKLSTVHCAKSQRGHQIHANPSPTHGGGSVSAITHTDTERAQTHYLVTKFRPRSDEMGHSHCKQTKIRRAWSIRPSDFDLIVTHDVGQYANSRLSEGASALLPGLVQHNPSSHHRCCREDNGHHFYSAHAIGFHSCVYISRSTKFLHQHAEHVKKLFCAVFRALVLQQVTHTDENHKKPVNSLAGRLERTAQFL